MSDLTTTPESPQSGNNIIANISSGSTEAMSLYLPAFVVDFITTLNYIFLIEIFAAFGLGTNVVNIIVFTRQGFQETVNITLVALGVGNMGALFYAMGFFMLSPWFLHAGLPFLQIDFLTVVVSYPHTYFIRVCGFINAFSSFSRCMCVVFPLRFKSIISKPVVWAFNTGVFVVCLLCIVHAFFLTYFDDVFVPSRNKTIIASRYRFSPEILKIWYLVSDLAVPISYYIIIVVSNIAIVLKLKVKAEWRKSTATKYLPENQISQKDKKVTRMLIMISMVFAICQTPIIMIYTASALERELTFRGKYSNVLILNSSFVILFDVIFGSVDIFIYYNMSTKFRNTFLELFALQDLTQKLRFQRVE
ncbi:allatostatin-A receptor-like [Physella acuta]|uniref:allatostatin-A receptor-like n=1 Tax=Physella acuta TaxID=109671 RepID=UPI0027DDA140|nr:allatostatin-A receptor-like [Physella acuta]